MPTFLSGSSQTAWCAWWTASVLTPLLDKLEAAGLRLTAFELRNEFNALAF
ncbi:MAG TPA: hypothetical protein VMQ17_11045 [Candidatus Sulfotelmatobacter sp.]|nr:hypothetical protein [Candidatus Sulfotelmatobacter sp.]